MASTEYATATVGIGEWNARLRLSPEGRVSITYLDPAGRELKRIARTHGLAAKHEPELRALKNKAADIERAWREARRRLEQSLRSGRDWSFDDWKARYFDHPMTRMMAFRTIWRFTPPYGVPVDAIPCAGGLIRGDGTIIPFPSVGSRVRLWHPCLSLPAESANWRRLLLAREIRQPFFQAWRPVYTLSDPELATGIYSNRFAGLVLDQPIFVALLRQRGWTLKSRMLGSRSEDLKPSRLHLPAYGLIAEYWGQGSGAVADEGHRYGAPNFAYFASSQLRFYREEEADKAQRRPVPLVEVPQLAFAETLFDLDLATGICAVGFDPSWQDPGPDAEPPPAEKSYGQPDHSEHLDRVRADELTRARVEMLAWLLPKLTIGDRCELRDHVLRVRGEWNHYSIHCGNGAVRLVEGNRHVCIIPGRQSSQEDAHGVPLPFVGDQVLSLILSKAVLLTKESRIKDPAITRQLR